MSDPKYYTPTIEEFHVGFEYEYKNMWTHGEFEKRAVPEHAFMSTERLEKIQQGRFGPDYEHTIDSIIYGIERKDIRVKYLDQQDIEELGWETIAMNGWQKGEAQMMRHPDGRYIILRSQAGTCLFDGILKNKSEFKKLLTQIGV